MVLFDGVCNLCTGTVRFIARRDPGARFRFAALQSPIGRELLGVSALPDGALETLVLLEEGRLFVRSTAALRIARRLSGLWPLAYGAIVIPRPIRDGVYRLIARHRYRLFGRQETCMIPSADLRSRFLE